MTTRIITRGGTDRAFKRCRCARCGMVRMCRPAFDFYTLPGKPRGLLYCEGCLYAAYDESKKRKERR